MRSVVKIVLGLFYSAFALVCLPLSLWLLLNAQTWVGRGIAGVGLILTVLPVTGGVWLRDRVRYPNLAWVNGGLLAALFVFVTAILLLTPSGRLPADSPVQHRFTKETRFRRYTLTNIIPEVEQVNLGFAVLPAFDPIMTWEQARRVAPPTFALYRELRQDPHFRELGSAMGWAYAELIGQPFDVGHTYLYVPQNRGEGPLPAVVFLHGSAGNFKAYLWLWSKLAEEHGIVIIAPSFGFGNWQRAGGMASVLRALEAAQAELDLDPERIVLAGLSNGGLGVSDLGMVYPSRFRGLIFVSPVLDSAHVTGDSFLAGWHERPILVITGSADGRILYTYVRDHIRVWEGAGVDVTQRVYLDADHFLFFSQADRALDDISAWLVEIGCVD